MNFASPIVLFIPFGNSFNCHHGSHGALGDVNRKCNVVSQSDLVRDVFIIQYSYRQIQHIRSIYSINPCLQLWRVCFSFVSFNAKLDSFYEERAVICFSEDL